MSHTLSDLWEAEIHPSNLNVSSHTIRSQQWENTKDKEDGVFPISKWSSRRFISYVVEGRLYPHYFRLNRANKFAKHKETSKKRLPRVVWVCRPSDNSEVRGEAGRVARKMAKRLK